MLLTEQKTAKLINLLEDCGAIYQMSETVMIPRRQNCSSL